MFSLPTNAALEFNTDFLILRLAEIFFSRICTETHIKIQYHCCFSQTTIENFAQTFTRLKCFSILMAIDASQPQTR